MVDIQSATAEIKRGKEDRRKKKDKTTGQKYNAPYYIGGSIVITKGALHRRDTRMWTDNN